MKKIILSKSENNEKTPSVSVVEVAIKKNAEQSESLKDVLNMEGHFTDKYALLFTKKIENFFYRLTGTY